MWFRKDLRLEDNTALIRALSELKKEEQLLCLFQLNPEQFKMGTKNHAYFFTALAHFAKSAKGQGYPLHFMYGMPLESFRELKRCYPHWHKIYFNEDRSGYGAERDRLVRDYFNSTGIEVVSTQDSHLHGPDVVKKNDGTYYKVFTPYYHKWRQLSKKSFEKLGKYAGQIVDDTVKFVEGHKQMRLLVNELTDDFSQQVGEKQAEKCLNDFVFNRLHDYERLRDSPALNGTSRLSPYLRTGELSIRKVWQAVAAMEESDGQQTFMKELAWRDFYYMIYSHNPQQRTRELQEKYQQLPWRHDSDLVDLWEQGRTGYPIIDAAMKQLNQTGWMHNRLRMLVASFLTKDLLIDWRLGEAYFAEQLIDYDPASNIGGWQWAASTGMDAAPYFRVFNPTSQSKKFDPEGTFIRTYLPILEAVPNEWIHAPHLMPIELQMELGVRIGEDYPTPIVDHQEARKLVLAFFND